MIHTTIEVYEIGPPAEHRILRQILLEMGFNLSNQYPIVAYFENGQRKFIIPFSFWMGDEELAELDRRFGEMLERA